jgi:N6-L-threonylcarbamoyladenine synthase
VAEVVDYPGAPDAVRMLGETRDDAVGEAFDKVARAMGLPYPGGPEIEKLAKDGVPNVNLPYPLKNRAGYDFSYSGLKTAVISYLDVAARGVEIDRANLAASFEERALSMLVDATARAVRELGLKTAVVAGGVGANLRLRAMLSAEADKGGFTVRYPSLALCTDNAAMIGAAAYFMARAGVAPASSNLDANASLRI